VPACSKLPVAVLSDIGKAQLKCFCYQTPLLQGSSSGKKKSCTVVTSFNKDCATHIDKRRFVPSFALAFPSIVIKNETMTFQGKGRNSVV
jgi:hypothetical protein